LRPISFITDKPMMVYRAGGNGLSILERISSEWAYATGAIRALRRTSPIARNPNRTVRDLFEDMAREHGPRMALFTEREQLSHGELNARANQYARWARAMGFGKGDVIALLMPNRPEYVAIWLGIAKIGGVTALLNTNLPGASLAHCIKSVDARAVIVDDVLRDLFETARRLLSPDVRLFTHGEGQRGETADAPRVDKMLTGFSGADIPDNERPPLTINDRCLYIFTSGTTGMPKAANMNHYRTQLALLGFAAITNATRDDRMYITLPMYHTNGGLAGIGAALTVGGSCYIREKFSAREFWADAVKHDCTMFFYIGELCRFLLAAPPGPFDTSHRIRICVGNGLRPDIFEQFRDRYHITNILEFYASTEGNITLFNFDSKPGAVGRIPKWMERKFVVKIARFDVEAEQPVRDADGRCIECKPNEIGEALGQILNDPSKPANRFEGYADKEASEKKILRDVFSPGDAWFRSGDLMRKDELGYFYFADRIGDTFRWKGENVSTTEVAEAMTDFPGIKEATVYGVAVPRMDGRAGMASLVVENLSTFDLAGFRARLMKRLPEYARPLFVRFQDHLEMTATFKLRKVDLVADGFDPLRIRDPIFFADPKSTSFTPIDEILYQDICSGKIRL
jgi:fatty-acyl-CoA synthase